MYSLTFTVPRAFGLVPSGRHQPCLDGCVLRVFRSKVTIAGPERAKVLDLGLTFVRVHARRGLRCAPISVMLAGNGLERAHIVVGDQVEFDWGAQLGEVA